MIFMFMFLGLPVGIYSMLIEAKKEKYLILPLCEQ